MSQFPAPSSVPTAAQAAHQLVTDYYAVFNSLNRAAFLALLTEDIVHDLNQGEREVGKAQFTAFLGRMDRCYREHIRDLQITVSSDGTHAGAEYVVHGSYLTQDTGLPPATGQTYI